MDGLPRMVSAEPKMAAVTDALGKIDQRACLMKYGATLTLHCLCISGRGLRSVEGGEGLGLHSSLREVMLRR